MDRFTQLPFIYQVTILLLIAVGLWALFEFVDFGGYLMYPELNPLMQAKTEQVRLQQERDQLAGEVAKLNSFRAQYQQRLQDLEEAKAQLAILRVQVPNEKLTDDFLRSLEGNALSAQISIRSLVSQPSVFREFYAEMPFQMGLDGPYYNLKDYFERVGATERITNVGSLDLDALQPTSQDYTYTPGSTVKGAVQVTTYYIPSEEELAANAPPAQGQQPGARPGVPGTPPGQR